MAECDVRRGADVIKARALGANMVLVGRPFLYAASVGGEAMVSRAAEILQSEIHRNIGLLGLHSVDDITDEVLFSLAPIR